MAAISLSIYRRELPALAKSGMTSSPNLDQMSPDQLRALAAQLLSQVDTMGKKITRDQTVIEKLTFEIAQLKRLKFAKRSEQMNPEQASLLDDLIDTDIAAIEAELQALQAVTAAAQKKQKPKRTTLPVEFPRTLIHHEPDNSLPMRLRPQAHRRGRQREAGLHARCVHCRTPCSWQVGLR
jgi:hypothetical protein